MYASSSSFLAASSFLLLLQSVTASALPNQRASWNAVPRSPAVDADYGKASCRCRPGDACWPNARKWAQLNETVGGRLIATVPLASSCHDPNYDASSCAKLKDQWIWPEIHESSSSSIMSPWAQNGSCDPFTPQSSPCLKGNYVEYAIRVASAADVSAGVRFAQDNNIRFVVKNTGHDFLGKSTGAGALSIWTNGLRDVEYVPNYKSGYYNGPAVKVGSGVRGFEVYEALGSRGVNAIGGSCPTVGMAGGFIQGGGHSPLSSLYGLGADQALEWEVITANDGKRVVATPRNEHKNLYWALGGGGGGTYGVVVSVTVRVHPDPGSWGGASLAFAAAGLSPDTYWAGVKAFFAAMPAIFDTRPGVTANGQFGSDVFFLAPLNVPKASEADVRSLLQPFTTSLDRLNITYSLNVTSLPTYLDHYRLYFGPLPWGPYPVDRLMTGQFLPFSTIKSSPDAIAATMRRVATSASALLGFAVVKTSTDQAIAPNAAHPGWRGGTMSILGQNLWDWSRPREENVAKGYKLINEVAPALKALAPQAGQYLNEASPILPSWKEEFYGANYDRLRKIKKEYDPKDLFYGPTAVGSDAWKVAADGRMCRA
ncbi:MAG: hypothetical protein M1817_000740 [Caeruleum heppii]|nr:MAG: hypothetical protein M1817_000740 [Caeruleum heppii]